MAAALFNKYSESGHADSAGTKVKNPGETVRERAEYSDGAKNVIAALREEGIDITTSKRQQVTPEMLDDYDKVIVMAEPESIPEWLSAHPKYEYWHIEDPRYKGFEETKKTQGLIKEKVLGLIE